DEIGADAALADAARALDAAGDLATQRAALAPLGGELRELLEVWHVDGLEAWVVHCPMALDGEGADWLAATPEVLNPYLGAEMPRCGTVRRALHADGGAHGH
ncbi:MAG TPA: hypothetical protein VMT18_08860, partial [Planctomycetota bacterium]|nr:hypothetical protein [Planctomycetota bacterium]